MRRENIIGQIVRQMGLYSRSLVLFAIAGLIALAGYWWLVRGNLQADGPLDDKDITLQSTYDLDLTLTDTGGLYLGNSRLSAETVITATTYHVRYQIIDRPKEFIETFSVAVHLPQPGNEETIGHRFINNGGALSAESQLVDPQTVVYRATDLSSEAQLAIELEVPKSFVRQSLLFALRERVAALPLVAWSAISIALPALTGLILFLVMMARARRVAVNRNVVLEQPPSNLKPALLGILLRGQLTSREVAATLFDLARRGHLVIHQAKLTEFRFSRKASDDALEDFEKVLLEQIFGPLSQQVSGEEVNFSLEQELFSRRISQSFILAYQRISQLGYFYGNPLAIHRRYQLVGIVLFVVGLVGFFANLALFTDLRYSLLTWFGMMIAALLITHFAHSLPVRSTLGDQELSRWLSFGRYLATNDVINYAAHSQEKYLAYLPVAIVLGLEVEWTKRFYELPFAQPNWYIAAQITTIDDFANKIFPMFGYLSQLLASSSQPATR